jgi:hypothetical protein
MVRADGTSSFPCLVQPRNDGVLTTYMCPVDVPAGANITSVQAYGYRGSNPSGYFEASVHSFGASTFAPTCWSSNACVWQKTTGLPVGNTTLTLHSGSHTVDAASRYVIGFALKGFNGSEYAYGFRVTYVEAGTTKNLSIAANSCVPQL